ncbi:hypothetical protein D0809_18460 [Flavobacterium circumlabens]|uniref:ApeA N-terminal domain-containing protein n=1 Tax=Flavobacterium circumlabens TaxID=2133765 RepID=A0A4Y7U8T6_9FLAO|nr:hypothetical protein [Flavobacterium circumlabens]TCN54651.1 hypothetical protein EV142_107151 [Flavobacterium circumlabens]TEB42845.1 hypothetical protein D0809_18460 [Flavobacterium circumlabens]
MPKIANLCSQIINEINIITGTKIFEDWLENENLSSTASQFIAFNNSFIFRDNIKTIKSQKYLAFDVSNTGKFTTKKIYVIEGINFHSHFKIFTLANTHKKTSLSDAVKIEIKEIGEVIYTIVGEIQDINIISESIGDSRIKKITLDPNSINNFEIKDEEIIIKDYVNREWIWSEIKQHYDANNWPITDNLPGLVDKAITNFQSNAYSTLIIPKTFSPANLYLLDKISLVINDHLKTYQKNILNIDNDSQAMIEILRISYNFVSDVNKLLSLVINLCDLKPIILWLTISKYITLDNTFKDLPFGFSKKKASLLDYERVIKNARNKSFHQLFPFNKSLKFELESLKEVSVTIFSNFTKKDGNKMTYKDQELYDLLRGFTRVNEEVVSSNFWIKNEYVMQAVYELIDATSQSIKNTK